MVYEDLFSAQGLFHITVLLNTAKNTRDPFAIRVTVRAAYLSSVML